MINIITKGRNGNVVSIQWVSDEDELMVITQKGMILRTPVSAMRTIGRNTQGVRLIQLEKGDKVVAAARLAEKSPTAASARRGARRAARANPNRAKEAQSGPASFGLRDETR